MSLFKSAALPRGRGCVPWGTGLLVLGLLGGCASAVRTDVTAAAAAAPADWSMAPEVGGQAQRVADQAALAQWWRNFNDPWLVELVQQALQANTGVRLAQAALQQSRALRDVAAAGDVPTVRGSASAQRAQVGDNTPANAFRAGFDASWEPDVFGARAYSQGAAQADVQAAQAALGQVRVSLAAEVAANVIELRSLALRQRLARDNLARLTETFELTRWRVEAGLASAVDLEQARTTLEQARAALPALQTGVRQSLHALAVLTGQVPGALSSAWQAQAEAAIPSPPGALALSFPAETLRQRPDVRVAEERVSAAWARARVADANRYPTFSLNGSLGLGANRLGDLFDIASLTRSVLASVSASLFDGGARLAQLRAQEALLEQARINHEAAVLAALQDVENALAALQGNRERLARLQAAAQAASDAEWLARQRYTGGLIDYRSLLDTQRTLIAVQTDLALVQATLSADHVRLYKALGGGWSPDTDMNP